MNNFNNGLFKIIKIVAVIGGIFLIGLMLITLANVLARHMSFSIKGYMEISIFLIIVAASCSFAYTQWFRGHVAVDIIVQRLKSRTKRIIEIFCTTITAITVAFITWASFNILLTRLHGEYSEIHHIPYPPFRSIFVIGLLLYFVVLIYQLYQWIREGKLREELKK